MRESRVFILKLPLATLSWKSWDPQCLPLPVGVPTLLPGASGAGPGDQAPLGANIEGGGCVPVCVSVRYVGMHVPCVQCVCVCTVCACVYVYTCV